MSQAPPAHYRQPVYLFLIPNIFLSMTDCIFEILEVVEWRPREGKTGVGTLPLR